MPSSTMRALATVVQHLTCGPMAAASGAIQFLFNGSAVWRGEPLTPGGLVPITYNGGAGAYTLATPVAGGPTPTGSAASGGQTGISGDDGKEIIILSDTAQAHVVTTAAGKIIGQNGTAYGTMTFAANRGAFIRLIAYNGFWRQIASSGVTLT